MTSDQHLHTDGPNHDESRSVNAESQANDDYAFHSRIKKHWRYYSFLTISVVIFIVCGIAAGSLFAAHLSGSTEIFPGDVVQVLSLKEFWFDEAKISQKAPDRVEQSDAIIYLENCNSKEKQDTLPFLSRPIPYTLPEGLFQLQKQYLLAHSSLEINVTAYVYSDSNANAKICQFSNARDYGGLLAADSKEQLDEAEMKGSCQSIEPPSNTSPLITKMHFNIRSHGYYYYALAVDPDKQINMSYSYTLYRRYYDREELIPYNCSVENQDCVIRKLTTKRRDACILAFIPTSGAVEPSLAYTFSSRQSHPYGIFIIFLSVVFFIGGIYLLCCALACAYCDARVRKQSLTQR